MHTVVRPLTQMYPSNSVDIEDSYKVEYTHQLLDSVISAIRSLGNDPKSLCKQEKLDLYQITDRYDTNQVNEINMHAQIFVHVQLTTES